MKLLTVSVLLVGSLLLSNLSPAQQSQNYLADNTILITGGPLLTESVQTGAPMA
jgi:hypothetical protein